MTPTAVNDWVNFIALMAGIPAFLFTFIYGAFSPWYKSWLGRTLFGLMFSITALFIVILARRFFGEYPGYNVVGVVVYALLAIAFWSFLVILLVERRHAKPLEIALKRETTEIPIIPEVRNEEVR